MKPYEIIDQAECEARDSFNKLLGIAAQEIADQYSEKTGDRLITENRQPEPASLV